MFSSLGAFCPQKTISFNLKSKTLSVSISVALALTSLTALGADEEDAKQGTQLRMIQVVGQATGGLDSVITEESIGNHQAESLGELFRSDPSVASGGSVGMSEKIYVRNMGEDITSITVDGAEQANAVFHHSGRIALEPELIKRVEIEAGAGSATAGPGALGGSVKFTTKDPVDLLKKGEQFGALLKAGVSSNGDGKKTSVTLFGQDDSEKFGGMISLMKDKADNLEDGDGNETIGSESDQGLGYAKLVANITDEQYLSLSYENIKEDGDILYKPEWIAGPRNVAEPTKGDRKTTTLNYGVSANDSDWLDLLVTIYGTEYFQYREEDATFKYEGSVKSTGLTLQNTSRVKNHELIYGINYRNDESYLDDVTNYDDVVDFGDTPVYKKFEETGKVIGIYVQDIINVTKQLTVSTGLRFDEYKLKDEDGLSFKESGISPNLSANFAINLQWGISAGYAEAFRGPEVEDAFRVSFAENDADLEAETAKNTELAVDYNNGGIEAGAGVFKTTIESAILRTPPWSSTVNNLEDDIETKGFFVNIAYKTDSFNIAAKYLSADTEVDGQIATRYVYGSKATSIGDTLVIDLDYSINHHWQAGWVSEFVQDINGIQQEVGGENLSLDKEGYDIHDVYVRWQPLEDDQLWLNLAIHNLFDKQYLSHASIEDYQDNTDYEDVIGSPAAGRDIRLTATWHL